MEDTLGDIKIVRTPDFRGVLILVLMEDTLGVNNFSVTGYICKGLNPCSNGRYSRSRRAKTYESFISEVLIIIRPTNLAFVNTN